MKKIAREDNNLDILRLLAAWMILYSHSFILYGNKNDFSDTFLVNYSTSHIALSIFFIISGYLITASYYYKSDLKLFMASRLLRLIPALAVVLLITVFVLGPVATNLTLGEYFSDINTYKYLRGVLLFPLKYELPGVFNETPYPNAVNGSLWSLEVEFKCYLMIAALGVCKLLRKNIIAVMTVISILMYLVLDSFPEMFDKRFLGMKYTNLHTGSLWFSAFLVGASFFLFKDKIEFNRNFFIAAVAIDAVLWVAIPFGEYFRMITLGYIMLYLGFHVKACGAKLKGNDISYGVYIYAFPIQQLYMLYIGEKFGFAGFILICTLAVAICGFLSWRFVEKPALGWRDKFRTKKAISLSK